MVGQEAEIDHFTSATSAAKPRGWGQTVQALAAKQPVVGTIVEVRAAMNTVRRKENVGANSSNIG